MAENDKSELPNNWYRIRWATARDNNSKKLLCTGKEVVPESPKFCTEPGGVCQMKCILLFVAEDADIFQDI